MLAQQWMYQWTRHPAKWIPAKAGGIAGLYGCRFFGLRILLA
jgi:hypothetical protein